MASLSRSSALHSISRNSSQEHDHRREVCAKTREDESDCCRSIHTHARTTDAGMMIMGNQGEKAYALIVILSGVTVALITFFIFFVCCQLVYKIVSLPFSSSLSPALSLPNYSYVPPIPWLFSSRKREDDCLLTKCISPCYACRVCRVR